MARYFKTFILYCGLSLLFALLSIFWISPNIPNTLLGWVAVLVLPVPVTVAVDWFRQQVDNADIPMMDLLGQSIDRSPYRLLLTIALVAVAGVCGLGAMWMLTGAA